MMNMHGQAIVTKYLGPTDYLGGRIKARAQAGSATVGWSHSQSVDENHMRAAETLAKKLGWRDRPGMKIIGGWLPSGEGVHLLIDGGTHG